MSSALIQKTKSLKINRKSTDKTDLLQRAQAAYLGLAIGDALGATTEFMLPAEIVEQYGVHNKIIGGGWLRLKPGQVTDDTEMSLVLGESILQNKGVKATAVAEAFSEWMRSKPIDIGNTVRRGLIHYRTTGATEVPYSEFDAGNGSCMRALPIALYHWNSSDDEMLEASWIQSHVTHNNPVADAGTEAILLMVKAALNGGSRDELKVFSDHLVQEYKVFKYDRRRIVNPSGWVVETLQAVFQSFFNHDDFETTLIDVVNRGGDADTTGAIAGMLAGAFYGVDDIPVAWKKRLDLKVKKQCQSQAFALVRQGGN